MTRDRIMADYALTYPGYGWETNRGYPTPQHIRALDTLGLTPLHRRSFAPAGRAEQMSPLPAVDYSANGKSFESHHYRG